jgi:hypothetical protein
MSWTSSPEQVPAPPPQPEATTSWHPRGPAVARTLAATVLGLGNGIGAGLVMTLGADASPAVGRTQFLGGWRLFADVGRAAGPLALSGLSGIMTLGASSVVLGVGAVVGAGWLRVWVPRHDPTRRYPTAS